MDYNTIKSRHSVRAYTTKLIPDDIKKRLIEILDECNAKAGLNMQLVTDEPDAFGASFLARYGKFSNVRNYVCLIGPKDAVSQENIGYCGEIFVLKAQELGLNTCWVGLTFNKRRIPVEIGMGEKLHAVIAVGYGQNSGSTHKIKSPEQVCPGVSESPDWVKRGVDYALLAPSALNMQNFKFTWLGENRVRPTTAWRPYSHIDLGIAKLHFELGASPVAVSWEE